MSEKSVLFRLLFYTDPDPALFCTLPQILNNFFTTAKNCQQLKLADWKEQYLLSTWTGSNPDPKHSVFQTISNRRLLLNSGKGGSQADIEKLAEPLFAQTQPRVVSLFYILLAPFKEQFQKILSSVAEPVELKLFGDLEPEPKISLNKHFLQSVWRMLG